MTMIAKHPLRRKKLGELLVQEGRLDPGQLALFLSKQREDGRPLGEILIEHEVLTSSELTRLLATQLGIPHVWLRKGLVDPRIVHVLPKERAQSLGVVPMFRVGDELTLAVSDPNAIFAFDEIEKLTGLQIHPVTCRQADIEEAIDACYRESVSMDDVMASVEEASIDLIQRAPEQNISELAELADGSPVINLVNSILIRSIRDGASDIHIEPQTEKLLVRVRIDGRLYELMSPKIELHGAVVSRMKVMAKLDISERRLPQDGRMQVSVDGRFVDLRFSSMPGMLGEKVVLRILDKSGSPLELSRLGFDEEILSGFKEMLTRPHGLLLTCGPTGSGKTTTLYSALAQLNSADLNIVTIEDPVEYQFENINQNQVKEGIGLTFARFIKHTLRQDPDVIMVGEIRDRETAETAIQAALTGHLVLSTIHTNDSASTITRLLEMGIEPFLIASSVLGSMAQRLVRTICPDCRTDHYPSGSVLKELGIEEDEQLRLAKGRGCKACYDSGFRGRTGIYELLEMDEGLQALTLTSPTIDELRNYLRKTNRITLRKSGHNKVLSGKTTIEEIRRAVAADG